LPEENILEILPFNSKRKRGSIVVRNPDMKGTRGEVRVYCKGAPDFFLMDADPSSGISYPEMKFVQTEKGESRLEDTAQVPENLLTDGGPKKDT
jgi:magnesium-transporting ATPase (P-type)